MKESICPCCGKSGYKIDYSKCFIPESDHGYWQVIYQDREIADFASREDAEKWLRERLI